MQLYNQLSQPDLLQQAWQRVADNDGAAGIDNVSIEEYSYHIEDNLQRLQEEFQQQSYEPQPLLRFSILKQDGGLRLLSVPTVHDRIAQTACALLLTPIFEAEFEPESFGYRAGMSIYTAVAGIEKLRDEGYHWVVDADIEDYFDEVPHAALFDIIRPWINDEAIMQLINAWLKAPYQGENPQKRKPRQKGLPQGGAISPLLANAYLDPLDESIKAQGYKLIRYADDFIVLCKSKEKSQHAMQYIDTLLADMQLRLNLHKSEIRDFSEGFEYLGSRFVRSVVLTPRDRQRADALNKDSAPLPQTIELSPKELPPSPFMRALYLQRQGSHLRKDGNHFIISFAGEDLLDVPINKLKQIFVLGQCQLTTAAIRTCMNRDISLIYMTKHGRYVGHMLDGEKQNILLQQAQFSKVTDAAASLIIAKAIVSAKIKNSRTLLMRNKKGLSQGSNTLRLAAIDKLQKYEKQAQRAQSLDELRGFEGVSAQVYYQSYGKLFQHGFALHTRKRRPPPDPINSLLSFGYSLLFGNIHALIIANDLHPYLAHLHSIANGHAALVSDLIEEFRAPIIDGLVLYLINKKVIRQEHFDMPKTTEQPCFLTEEGRKTYIHHFEKRMQRAMKHPTTGYQVDWRRCINLQVQAYASWVRNDTPYQGMLTR